MNNPAITRLSFLRIVSIVQKYTLMGLLGYDLYHGCE